MILYRKEPIMVPTKNIMILDGSESSYIYVSKATYDQAVKLHSRFDGNTDDIFRFLTNGLDGVNRQDIFDVINQFCAKAPVPLTSLASFFILLKDNKGIEWDKLTEEDMYGYLHVMSQMLDFEAVTLVPSAVRATISIPTIVLKDYASSWNDFLNGLDAYAVKGAQPVQQVQYVQSPVVQPQATVASTPTPAPTPTPTTTATVQTASGSEPEPWSPQWMAEAVHMGGKMYQFRGEIFYKPTTPEEAAAKRKAVEDKVKAEEDAKKGVTPTSSSAPASTTASSNTDSSSNTHYEKPAYSAEEGGQIKKVLDEWDF